MYVGKQIKIRDAKTGIVYEVSVKSACDGDFTTTSPFNPAESLVFAFGLGYNLTKRFFILTNYELTLSDAEIAQMRVMELDRENEELKTTITKIKQLLCL
jgi:hypothetical protein